MKGTPAKAINSEKNPTGQCWRDGRVFASRVQVWAGEDRYLYRVHAEAAFRMCTAGAAEVDGSGRQIWRITITHPAPRHLQEESKHVPSAFDYRGHAYTFLEHLGDPTAWAGLTVQAFKPMDDRDRWAFVLSQTDCIPSS